jgi:hypothetical protein
VLSTCCYRIHQQFPVCFHTFTPVP